MSQNRAMKNKTRGKQKVSGKQVKSGKQKGKK
jgi:hypothetical protein